jgi:hypothetical protein
MTNAVFIEGFEHRLDHFGLDEQARNVMHETWPIIAPNLDSAIDDLLSGIKKLPHVAAVIARHRDLIKRLETAHFEALLSGGLDSRYMESCRRTVEQEAAIGIDGRMRSTAGNFVLRATLKALARKYWYSPRKLVDHATVVSQAIALDVTNAMALHKEAADRASAARRATIDAAIADFAAAIGGVVDAIKESSSSLTATCGTMKRMADDTLGRMASASSAAAETTRRV